MAGSVVWGSERRQRRRIKGISLYFASISANCMYIVQENKRKPSFDKYSTKGSSLYKQFQNDRAGRVGKEKK